MTGSPVTDPNDWPLPADVVDVALPAREGGAARSRREVAATLVGVVAVVASFVGDAASPLVALLAAVLVVVSRPVIERGVPLVVGAVDCWRLADRRRTRKRLRRAVEHVEEVTQVEQIAQLEAGGPARALFPVGGDPPVPHRRPPGRPGGGHVPGAEPLLANVGAAARTAEAAPSPAVLLNRWVCRAAQLLLYEQTAKGTQNEQLCADLERVPDAAGARDLRPMLDAHRALVHWRCDERHEARRCFTAALAAQPRRRLEAEIRTNFGVFLLPSRPHGPTGDGGVEPTDAERDEAREAAAELERALGLWPRRDRLGRATAALGLGAAYLVLGEAQEARILLERAREGFELLGMDDGVAAVEHNLRLLRTR